MKLKKFLCIILILTFALNAFFACDFSESVANETTPSETTPSETTPSETTPSETTHNTDCGGYPIDPAYYRFNTEAEAAMALKNPDLFFSETPQTREWKKINDMIGYFQKQEYIIKHFVFGDVKASDIYLSFNNGLDIPTLTFEYDQYGSRTISYTPLEILEGIDYSKQQTASEIIHALNPDYVNIDTFSENPNSSYCFAYKNVYEKPYGFSGKTTLALVGERKGVFIDYWFVIDGILFHIDGNESLRMNFSLRDVFTGESPIQLGMTSQELENVIGKEKVNYLDGFGENKYAFYGGEQYNYYYNEHSLVLVQLVDDKINSVKVLAPENLDFDVSFRTDFEKLISSSYDKDILWVLTKFGVPQETETSDDQCIWIYHTYESESYKGGTYAITFGDGMGVINIKEITDQYKFIRS